MYSSRHTCLCKKMERLRERVYVGLASVYCERVCLEVGSSNVTEDGVWSLSLSLMQLFVEKTHGMETGRWTGQ